MHISYVFELFLWTAGIALTFGGYQLYRYRHAPERRLGDPE